MSADGIVPDEAAVQHGAAGEGGNQAPQKVIPLIERMLRRDEGERLKVYTDSRGHPTIGVGRALDTHGITPAESAYLLANDIALVKMICDSHFPWYGRMTEERQAVLESMVFQLGIGGVLEFHNALAAMSVGAWNAAAQAMLDSEWAREQTPARAERLAEQMRTGEFQP